MGKRIEETVGLLRQVEAVGVWGNHDVGLCFDPDDKARALDLLRCGDRGSPVVQALEEAFRRIHALETARPGLAALQVSLDLNPAGVEPDERMRDGARKHPTHGRLRACASLRRKCAENGSSPGQSRLSPSSQDRSRSSTL